MLTDDRVISALASALELERSVRQQLRVEADAGRQRSALAVFRHAHALALALERWQDIGRGLESDKRAIPAQG